MREKYSAIPLINKQNKYQAEAKELGIMDAEDFDNFCNPLEGDSFIIEDWIPTQSLMMLFAPSGSGKGFIAIDIATSIASKEIDSWHGKKIFQHGPVVYLAGEGQKGMRKRCAGLAQHKGIQRKNVKIAILKEALDIDNKDKNLGVRKIIANIGMRYPNPSLVIIDTLNCYMGGDENKTVDATAFVKAAKEIMQEFSCSVMIVHHTGLNPENQDRVRGSSVLKAAMDMEMRVKKMDKYLTLEMTKSKDSEIQKPLVFEMIKVIAPEFFTEKGFPDTTCVLEFDEETSTRTENDSMNTKKLSQSEIFARETYQKAACDSGILVFDEKIRQETVAVYIEDWRKVSYDMSSADKDDTKRRQFNRSRQILLETNKILFKKIIDNKEFYCLQPANEVYDIGIIGSVRSKSSNTNN